MIQVEWIRGQNEGKRDFQCFSFLISKMHIQRGSEKVAGRNNQGTCPTTTSSEIFSQYSEKRHYGQRYTKKGLPQGKMSNKDLCRQHQGVGQG